MIERGTKQPMVAGAQQTFETAAASAASAVRGEQVFNALFGRHSLPVSVLVLGGSLAMPIHGVGFTICWLHHLTGGLPCPGCGLTRSVACLSHMEWAQAFAYHPFGILLWTLAFVVVAVRVGGDQRRSDVKQWLMAHGAVSYRAYMAAILAFLAFGVVRFFWHYALANVPAFS